MENEFASSAPEINPDAVDLDTIEKDLADVETALARLKLARTGPVKQRVKNFRANFLQRNPLRAVFPRSSYRAASPTSAEFRDTTTRV